MPWDTIIWATAPAENPILENPTVGVEVFHGSLDVLGLLPWLAEAHRFKLGETIMSISTDSMVLHQGLVTMLYSRFIGLKVYLNTWSWLAGQLKNHTLPAWLQKEYDTLQNVVIFLHWTSTLEPQDMGFQDVYAAIRRSKTFYPGKIRPYPSETELWQDRMKLGDMRALDEIATLSPPQFSHRPRTCLGYTACTLLDCPVTVHKRTHSSCAKHVQIIERGKQSHRLRCTGHQLPAATSTKQHKNSELQWFHQEYIPSLVDFGEFRIEIVTSPSESGKRGRAGKIEGIVRTRLDRKSGFLHAIPVQPSDFLVHGTSLEREQLEEFGLFIFEQLRARPDALAYYESLEVGVRLDVGILKAKDGEQHFFVNEITRWYGAHLFSQVLLPEPKTQLCQAYAVAFVDYVRRGMPEVY